MEVRVGEGAGMKFQRRKGEVRGHSVGSGGFSYNGEGGEGMFGNRFAEVRVRAFWLEKVGCGDERPITHNYS